MASSRFQLVALLVIFSLVIAAQSAEKEVRDGPCLLRGTCSADSDCDTHCHRKGDGKVMDGHCLFEGPKGRPVCCCLSD
ncbi:unnamed protein product [Microthlaspi erraticum]|uniref:Knottin scorpion toxin-like domain-containing protein n=1 Tax=Microthlaspi erraticum TaxID=1685480 RepID=A0A6D2IG82_9BRAS|nr:unnamed protein product [Microthlaspi erraticum]